MSYHVLSVCRLCSNGQQWSPVSCPMKSLLSKEKCARVKVKYTFTRPFSTFAIIAKRTFLLFSVPVTDPRNEKMSYVVLFSFKFLLVAKVNVLTPPFLKRLKSLFVTLVSIKLVTFVSIYPKRFFSLVVYQSLQQTSAAPCGALPNKNSLYQACDS